MGPGGEGVEDALYIRELGVSIVFEEGSNVGVIKEGIFPPLHVARELFGDVFREGVFGCLYAVFGDCGSSAALASCASARPSATFIGCLSHLPTNIKYLFPIG